MKSKFGVSVSSKNLTIANDGININLTLDKSYAQNLSLKSLLKNSLRGAAFLESLNIQLVLAGNVHVDIVDDLLDFDVTRSKIEFVLNKGATLNYELKIIDSHDVLPTDGGTLIAYNQQGMVEKELNFKFVGEHSFAKVRCACHGTHDRMFRFKTQQDHQAAYSKSDLVIKGVFCQKSQLVCDSLIRVPKEAQKVEVRQLNKNLLLGCHSRAISIPKLEVNADDVKCKHGAAVSKLDEEQLFYLQSRGMSYCEAKNLLIGAFLS
jgi:hypothetical protein